MAKAENAGKQKMTECRKCGMPKMADPECRKWRNAENAENAENTESAGNTETRN